MGEPDEEALRSELDRQAALRREADHRVKNNLQLISSLILLQSRRDPDEAVRAALKGVLQRVTAVSVAHRHVLRGEEGDEVEVAGLVRELVGDLAASAGRNDIAIALELEPVTAPARHGAPLALLVNEVVGNALRHAFPDGRSGRVRVTLRRTGEGFELAVADDGAGPADGAAPKGFGLTIVQLLAQQLRATLEAGPSQPGFRVAVSIPMDREAAPA